MPSDTDRDSDLSFGAFTIVRADERVVGTNGPVKLGRKAYRLLLMLAEREGQLLTKDALFASVWDGTIVSESALTSVIKELRRALDDQSVSPRYIESVYGRGYRLLPPVSRCLPTRLRAPDQAAFRPAETAAPLGRAPLLFVPPFDESAIADTNPHLGAVLHEEVLIALSRFRDIRLISDLGPSHAADRFGKRDYRLSIRLLRHGEAIQAFTRISRLSSGAIIWADQMALASGNPMQSVDDIARRVAGIALPRLRDDMLRNVPEHPGDAYDQYFLNRLRMRDLDALENGKAAAAAWEHLIEEHPELVQAYPPLTRLYNTDYGFTGLGSAGRNERRRAYELAHRAITIDPTDSHLHTAKGWCHLWASEPDLASRHFEEAVQLNPYHQERLVEVATGFMFLDELDRATEILERCRALTGFASEAPQEEEGLLLLLRQDYRQAAEALALARRVHPDDRVKARPSPLTRFYALLAAAGEGDAGLAEQAGDWRRSVEARWAGPDPLDDARLTAWILFHNPFQREERRAWLLSLVALALAPEDPAEPNRLRPASRGTLSARG